MFLLSQTYLLTRSGSTAGTLMKTTELVTIKYWKREAYSLVSVLLSFELEFCFAGVTVMLVILRLKNELEAVGVMAEGLGTTCVKLVLVPGGEQLTP